jgi:large subunit ribosomal protein L7A
LSITELYSPEKRVVGFKQVQRFARQSMIEKVYIAKDADEAVTEKIKHVCSKHGIPYDMMHTMHQIGNACRIDVGSSCAGVLRDAAVK